MIKRTIIILLGSVALFGCASKQQLPRVETKIVKQVQYVVRIPPKELTTMPPKPENIDIDSATQRDVAEWSIRNEEYINALVNGYILIAKFLSNEQIKLDAMAVEENAVNSILTPLLPPVRK